MKKLFTGGNIFPLFLAVILLLSCSKSDPGPQPVNPPAPAAPTISVTAPAVGWFNSNVSVGYTVSTGDNIVVTVNGSPITTNPYVVANVTTPVSLTFTATGKGGSDSQTVSVSTYPQDKTWLCTDLATGNNGATWDWVSGSIAGTPMPAGSYSEKTKFFIDGSCTYYPTGMPPLTGGNWALANGTITMGNLTWNVTFVDNSTFVRTRTNSLGQLIVDTFKKQ